jgi:hypothetical protein
MDAFSYPISTVCERGPALSDKERLTFRVHVRQPLVITIELLYIQNMQAALGEIGPGRRQQRQNSQHEVP